MKKLLILSFILSMSLTGNATSNHFNKQIGTVSGGGTITLTMSQAQIFAKVEAVLATNNIMVTFTSAQVVHIADDSYNILLSTSGGSNSTVVELILDNGILYEHMTIAGGGTTATCTGCTSGCIARKYEGITNCTPCGGGGPCVKTETLVIGDSVL